MAIEIKNLIKYCEAKNVKLESDFYYHPEDARDLRIGEKKIDEVNPVGIMLGFEYKKHNYAWFKYQHLGSSDIKKNSDVNEVLNLITDKHCMFSNFYNRNNGVTRTGFKCGFNFEMKIEKFLSENN